MSSHLKGMAQALNKKAGAANNFTPSLNNITGKYPKNDNSKVFIGKGGQNQPSKPLKKYPTRNNKSVE